MSDCPAPVPDPSQSQPQPESVPVVQERYVIPPLDLPGQIPGAEMGLAMAEGLSDEQWKVMSYITAGHSTAKSARFGRVSRRTVYRWLKDDANFCAAYNAWRRELMESAKTRVLAMADDAVDTIHNAILAGNVNASLAVAKSMGLLAKPRVGPDEPHRVAHRRRVHQIRRAAADHTAVQRARSDLPYNHPLRHTPEERARMEEADRQRHEADEQQQEQQAEWQMRFREATETRRKSAEAAQPQPQPQADPVEPVDPVADSHEQPET